MNEYVYFIARKLKDRRNLRFTNAYRNVLYSQTQVAQTRFSLYKYSKQHQRVYFKNQEDMNILAQS
jgi:hypothetical protein